MAKKPQKTAKKSPIILKSIKKRDGQVVPFALDKIINAVSKAMTASGEGDSKSAELVARAVKQECEKKIKQLGGTYLLSVEEIQDIVEKQLILHQLPLVSKAYILYRERRAELRRERGEVPKQVRDLVKESKKYFKNQLSEFVYYSTYSRWLPELNRREAWVETVERYVSFMKGKLGDKLTTAEYDEVREHMRSMKAMGSMRLLWAAGKAVEATNVCAYNCSYIAPAKWRDFGEIMYVLMCGTGLGFSVERQAVERLPIIDRQQGGKPKIHTIEDSKEGWADAYVLGLETWAQGNDVIFDYSQIRPQGSRLKTMGGRASGPEPLRNLLDFSRARLLSRQGRRLTTIDVHDIICKTGEVVVMGGVRRSALISLSDLDDNDMKEAKNGQFYFTHPERTMANNSAVYNEKPTTEDFLEEWLNLVKSGSGERGLFNRGSLQHQLPARRWAVFAPDAHNSGLNPCGEIVLKSKQFCNLSEVVARAEDSIKDLENKVKIATILGTFQATLTNFPYLSKEWKKNCEEERLLGVSITGHWDCPALRQVEVFDRLRQVAIDTNKKYAKRFGINPSTAITCVKPSGNGSQLFDSSSGCHPRHAEYYIRRVRLEKHNPLYLMLKDMGAPCYPEVGQTESSATTFVFEFPIKSPKGAITKKDLTAIDHLEYWKMVKTHYTEHNPSVTISVAADEWIRVGNWVYENWELVGGLSFLPKSDHVYKLAPYEEISKDRYEVMVKNFPTIDFSKIVLYEYEDTTTGSKELACTAGGCEVDINLGSDVLGNKKSDKK